MAQDPRKLIERIKSDPNQTSDAKKLARLLEKTLDAGTTTEKGNPEVNSGRKRVATTKGTTRLLDTKVFSRTRR